METNHHLIGCNGLRTRSAITDSSFFYCSNLDAGDNYSAHACLSHLVICFRNVPERVTTLKQMILGLEKVGYRTSLRLTLGLWLQNSRMPKYASTYSWVTVVHM